jgi:hypothetical protein
VFSEHKEFEFDAEHERTGGVLGGLVQTVRDNVVEERIQQQREPNDNFKDEGNRDTEILVVSVL